MDPEKSKQEEILKEFVEKEEGVETSSSNMSRVGPAITELPGTKVPWEKSLPIANQIGWIPLTVKDLPTRGLFYPPETAVAIRSATGAEIRHWSTLQENDLSALDDMLNYIIERCVTIKSANETGGYLSWKDIKEVDRFYLLLAIHELTFVNAENKLQIQISENKKLDVRKEMVNYVSIDTKLMRYYDEVERCFVLTFKNGRAIKVDIPSIGVTQWLKNYIIRKQNNGEPIDEDYLQFAPFVIRSWKGLNDNTYNKYVEESQGWDVKIISLLVTIKQLFLETVNPVVKYIDEGGAEQTAPLNFQGGLKAIFIIPDVFSELV